MIVDLRHIFVNENSCLPIEYSLDLSDLEFAGTFPLKKPVTIKGTVSNKAGLVSFLAHIYYEFEAPCDRCGQITAKEYDIPVSKALATSVESEESDGIIATPDMKLDIDELVYAETVSNLPMKHLCREDCKGICQKCGKNLNEGECGCPSKEIDPRLAALAELLND